MPTFEENEVPMDEEELFWAKFGRNFVLRL